MEGAPGWLGMFLMEGTVGALVVAALDVLLVAWVVYKVLNLIKGTRAAQMLLGLGLIVAGFLASEFFGLVTLNWMLSTFFSSFVLLLIVVFQQDIRRGLQRVGGGRGSLLSGRTVEQSFVFEEVMKASVQLSQERIGALIVLEREAELGDYASEGVNLDARVSRELIYAILYPKSPIHDGAIIIQGGRIFAAGAILPLTVNPNVSRSMGTRHRAGIGLTEECDAVVIVVSEETGKISLVVEGRITRDLDGPTLRKVLHSLFKTDTATRSIWPFRRQSSRS